jgi:hypothetical protein
MKRQRPFLPPENKLPPAVAAEIEAGWQRYRGRGHSRKAYGKLIVPIFLAIARLAGAV